MVKIKRPTKAEVKRETVIDLAALVSVEGHKTIKGLPHWLLKEGKTKLHA